MSDELLIEYRDGIQILTINRPEARNACTKAVAEAIAAALDELARRDDLRLAIITGAGGTFCAGMDLKGFLKGERPSLPGRGFAGITEAPPGKPLIAAVEGYALAGGFELALASDLVVAANNAQFGLPEVKRGLCAAAGGLLRLQQQLPERIAMELVLTGDMFGAQRAYEFGLVNRLTPPGEALAGALELAQKIVANGPLAVAASKRVMRESRDWTSAEMFTRQREITDPVFASADAREGAAAFAEKRKAVWQGK
ncbi:crotonase/enoyl-CoA hydratase family protein [Paraburkholderia unamae]|uniref:Short chain enoyl-CoA hydratase n=1 Tax=Paraburkholderia unamae TaxID=219649 RepID=A0ABX5KRA2_9BURK|nr:crotonase/enoyl-CoA hydratase family protein [Paraburkholderia unamae]PVX82685.1 short chain enoyl-CoA hydratase [Paraburkholderia unamae]RAR51338.1 short chain enoyl-CoA hydratase [Paraburkholderia unamae]